MICTVPIHEYNHCHSPETGEFCSAPDSGGGGGQHRAGRFRILGSNDAPADPPSSGGKRTIRMNRHDNWYGYEGGKRVKAFGNSKEQTAEQAANAWKATIEVSSIADLTTQGFSQSLAKKVFSALTPGHTLYVGVGHRTPKGKVISVHVTEDVEDVKEFEDVVTVIRR